MASNGDFFIVSHSSTLAALPRQLYNSCKTLHCVEAYVSIAWKPVCPLSVYYSSIMSSVRVLLDGVCACVRVCSPY